MKNTRSEHDANLMLADTQDKLAQWAMPHKAAQERAKAIRKFGLVEFFKQLFRGYHG